MKKRGNERNTAELESALSRNQLFELKWGTQWYNDDLKVSSLNAMKDCEVIKWNKAYNMRGDLKVNNELNFAHAEYDSSA